MKLSVTVSRTRDGKSDYLQVMSADMVAVNVVLVADKIEVLDVREQTSNLPRPGPLEESEL